MKEKVALFLEAGAIEVWLITEERRVSFFNQQGQQAQSSFSVDLKELG
jgi:hypothetical protein